MSKVSLKCRAHVKVGNLLAGSTFIHVNGNILCEVVDLMKEDIFNDGAVLRDDLCYVVEVETGIVKAMPQTIEVEVVEVVVSEV